MVAATRANPVTKRFWSGAFNAPFSGASSLTSTSGVTVEEILAGGINEQDWSFPVIATTEGEDRTGDIVIAEGCDYSGFATSPVVFFDHQTIKFAVGTMRSPHDGRLYVAIIPGKGIVGRIWIYKREDTEHFKVCKDVFYLVKDGFLNGVSVGFDPLEEKSLPSGGKLYKRWDWLELSLTHIAANKGAHVIRDLLDNYSRTGKTLSPLVLKSLTAWENPAMSEAQTTKTPKEKSMTESSGTGGGFTVPQTDDDADVRKAIAERMKDHVDAAGDGHSVLFHPESGEVHHVHPDGFDEETLKSIHEDIADVKGVKGVSHGTKKPDGSGWEEIYCKEVKKSRNRAWKTAARRERRIAVLVERGQHLQGLFRKGMLSWSIRKSIEDCVHNKIPKIAEDHPEMPADQRTAVAFSMCGEAKKFLQPLVTKGFGDDDEENEPTETNKEATVTKAEEPDNDPAREAEINPALETDIDTTDELKPPSLELCQAAIENLEAAIPGLEPPDREFFSGLIEQVRAYGMEKHPEEDFGGEQEPDASEDPAQDAKEQEETDRDLARYKSRSDWKIKRRRVVTAARLKSVQKNLHEDHVDLIRKAADHLHAIGDLPCEETKGGLILKGGTAKHHAGCRVMGRKLDRLHGAVTKSETEKPVKGEETEETPSETAAGQQAESDLDLDRLLPELKAMTARLEAADKRAQTLAYQVTGKRA